MSDVFQKFIIEEDEGVFKLIIGKATYHAQLAHDVENVKGGGWYDRSEEGDKFKLYGSSDQFGKASFEDIKKCVKSGDIYWSIYGDKEADWKIFYKDETGEIFDLNNQDVFTHAKLQQIQFKKITPEDLIESGIMFTRTKLGSSVFIKTPHKSNKDCNVNELIFVSDWTVKQLRNMADFMEQNPEIGKYSDGSGQSVIIE